MMRGKPKCDRDCRQRKMPAVFIAVTKSAESECCNFVGQPVSVTEATCLIGSCHNSRERTVPAILAKGVAEDGD